MGCTSKLTRYFPSALWGAGVFSLLVFLSLSSALAQGVRFTLSPLSFDFELLPGSKENLLCTLFNDTDQETKFQVFVAQAIEERDGTYRPANPEDPPSSISCAPWIRLEEEYITIPPRSGRQVRATLTVPPSAKPGFYAAMVVFRFVREEEGARLQGTAAELKAKVDIFLSSLLFLRVRRRGVSERWSGKFGVIEAFGVQKVAEGLRFSATLANRGKDAIEGKGKLTVTNALGKKIIDAPLGSGRGRVLPGFAVDFVTLYAGNLPPGDYAAIATIDYGGVHKAEAKTIFHVEGVQVVEREKKIEGVDMASIDPVFLGLNKEILEGKISPKASRSFTVALHNDSPHRVVVRGIPEDPSEAANTHFSSFVSVSPETVEIEPYKAKTVRIAVAAPEDILEGDKYVRVHFVPESIDGKKVPGELQKAFGASTLLVLENVKGTRVEAIRLTGLEFLLEEPQKGVLHPRLVLHFVNTGNTHLQPNCLVTLTQVVEEKVEEGALAVKPSSALTLVSRESPDLVLPGMEGMLVLEPQGGVLTPGKYDMLLVVQNGGKEVFREKRTLELYPAKQ
ncbi:MAG: DUF916 domain-containing protein [Atribacterota bacterium]